MPITGITIEADSVVIKGTDFDALCALAAENDRLRKEMSLAEEGLANATQENEQLQAQVVKLQKQIHIMAAIGDRQTAERKLAQHDNLNLVRANADLRSDLTAARLELETLRRQNERLRNTLFRHACYCGCGSPQHELHRTDCPYRIACTPHPSTGPAEKG